MYIAYKHHSILILILHHFSKLPCRPTRMCALNDPGDCLSLLKGRFVFYASRIYMEVVALERPWFQMNIYCLHTSQTANPDFTRILKCSPCWTPRLNHHFFTVKAICVLFKSHFRYCWLYITFYTCKILKYSYLLIAAKETMQLQRNIWDPSFFICLRYLSTTIPFRRHSHCVYPIKRRRRT